MTLPAALDVAIGVVLMYLILSLAVTAVGELIATALSLRGRHLSRTITVLLDDKDVRKRFYEHGLIVSAKMAARAGEPLATEASDPQASRADAAAPDAKTNPIAPSTDAAGVPRDKDHPSYFEPRIFAMALLDSLSATRDAQGRAMPGTRFEDLKTLAQALPGNSKIRDVVTAALEAAEGDAIRARDEIAAWFDGAMDRLSGDFARESKRIALGVGLSLAIILNADTFAVARALWTDEDLRAEVVAAAAAVRSTADLKAPCADEDPAARLACQIKAGQDLAARLQPFPIGWGLSSARLGSGEAWSWIDLFRSAIDVVLKVLGLAFTGFALSFGAPFWFDLLQKVVNLRGAGPKPKRSADA